MKITKEQLLCIAGGIVLAAASFITREEFLIKNPDGTYAIERPSAGGETAQYEVTVSSGNDRKQIKISVSPRLYTEEESVRIFEEMIYPAVTAMLLENTSVTDITGDLCFFSALEGYPGISVSWKSDNPLLISTGGKVNNSELTEPHSVVITVAFHSGTAVKSYDIPVLVCPADGESGDPGGSDGKESIEELLKKADVENGTGEYIVLPSDVSGMELDYSEPKGGSSVFLIAAGIAAAVLLGFKPAEDEKKKKKERETELLLDYSDVVSKLIVYIGAGLTVRNAWDKLASEHIGEGRAVYIEITAAAAELKNGESESSVYLKFAKRCGLRCYTRLAALLDQNIRIGDEALLNALLLEMDEAFEQRKNTARRLGEEAGTKLILPLMMLLVTVLIMVAAPAMFTLV